MKKLLAVFSILIAFSMSLQGVMAQSAATTTDEAVADENGMIFSYERTYEVDMWSLMEDPEFDLEDPASWATMMETISIQIMGFDTEENLDIFFNDGIDDMQDELDSDPEYEYEVTFPTDFGPNAVKIVLNTELDEGDEEMAIDLSMVMIAFSDGTEYFVISVLNTDPVKAESTAQAVAEYVRDAEVTTDELTINDDETFSGFVFDRMPAPGSDVVNGLPAYDYDYDDWGGDSDWDSDYDWDADEDYDWDADADADYDWDAYQVPAPEGLIYAFERTYDPDFDALLADDSDEEMDIMALLSQSSSIAIFGFDTEAQANAYLMQSLDEMTMDADADIEEFSVDVAELPTDFGRDGVSVTSEIFGITVAVAAYQDGTDVIIITAMGTDIDTANAQAMTLAEFVRDHAAGAGEVVFTDTQATGGVFDRMPTEGDDIVAGLIWIDSDLSEFFSFGDE